LAFLLGTVLLLWAGTTGIAQDKSTDLTLASKMFSDETQAFVVLPDSERFLEHWNRTELGKLASDNQLKQFWDTQRDEIQGRFKQAGWQLSLEIEDLAAISGGQTALGWIGRPNDAAKPFSIGMVIDIAGRIAPTEKFLEKVAKQLKSQNATAKTVDVSGVKVTQYTLPKAAGETRAKESFYVVSKDQLLASDDLVTITELLKAQDGSRTDSLANSALYQSVQTKIHSEGEPPELEYFVRPIGFAKLLRSISSKPSNNQVDILKLLDSQGFSELQCFAGNIQLAAEQFDFFHNGYVLAKKPLPESVQILDFPNLKVLQAPDWINKETASVMSFSWNIQEAFPKFKGIVDAYVGKGTFEDVIKAMKEDINGPQIDIIKEVLPYITTEFHVVTQVIKPIAPDSKRSMVILKLNDPDKKLPKVLERFGKSEPDAKEFDFEGYRIWRKKVEEVEIQLDFDKDAEKSEDGEDAEEEALLDEWAITIMDDYFIFASNADTITETIRNAKNMANTGAFAKEGDVARVNEILETVSGNASQSFSQLTRADLAFEMQYELFRENNLPKSQSMLASILDKILKPKDARNGQPQKVHGDALPPFANVKAFFTPSGGIVRSEDDGWSIQSFILSK
jgi:hypothetical protein